MRIIKVEIVFSPVHLGQPTSPRLSVIALRPAYPDRTPCRLAAMASSTLILTSSEMEITSAFAVQ